MLKEGLIQNLAAQTKCSLLKNGLIYHAELPTTGSKGYQLVIQI